MIIKLFTLYDNKPAPGGLYYTETKTYVKVVRASHGGTHPYRLDYGGFDDPIIQKLKEFCCENIELQLPFGTFRISFEDFIGFGYHKKWNDGRFLYPRWYCSAGHWRSDSPKKSQEGVL